MKKLIEVNFNIKVGNCLASKYNYLIFKIENSTKYGVSVQNWGSNNYPQNYQVINLMTNLTIGYLQDCKGYYDPKVNKFKRSWGFDKKLGKNGRVRQSAQIKEPVKPTFINI